MKQRYLFTNMHKGFTLIELLVVTAIIALLTTIVTVQIQGSLKDSRDARRIANLTQIELALEVYREANGTYPSAGCGASSGEWAGHGTNADDTCNDFISGISGIVKLPRDETTAADGYMYVTNGTAYKVVAFNVVEGETVDLNHEQAPCPSGCSGGCAVSGTDFTDTETQSTYGIWSGSTYECTIP